MGRLYNNQFISLNWLYMGDFSLHPAHHVFIHILQRERNLIIKVEIYHVDI